MPSRVHYQTRLNSQNVHLRRAYSIYVFIKTFLKFCYPKRDIKFIEIKNYAGKGSGPGKSLLQCKRFLNKSFYFVSCDTIWKEKIYYFR